MSVSPWLFLTLAVITTTFGQVTFKQYFLDPRLITLGISIALFMCSLIFPYLALRNLGIGTVYMSMALTQVLVLVLARFNLHENLTRDHWIAAALIICGIVVYAL